MRTERTLLALALAISGCGVRGATVLPNPLAAGAVAPNEAHERHGFREASRGLPSRSLSSWASLVRLDRSEVCFDLNLRWADDDAEAYVDPGRLVARLEIEEPDHLLTRADRVEAASVERSTLVGQRNEVRTRTKQVCEERGRRRRCWDVSESESVPVEREYAAATGRGTVCFRHAGLITSETEALILRLSHPAEGERTAHRFAWRFEG